MTRQEAEENLGKYVTICAPGLKRGYKTRKILAVDPHDRTLWGKGSIIIQDKDGHGKKSRTKMSFDQAQLYEGDDAPELPAQRKRKRKDDEKDFSTKRRRRRTSVIPTTEKRRRRRKDV